MKKTKVSKFFNKKSSRHFSKLFIKNRKKFEECVDIEGKMFKEGFQKLEIESFHSAIGSVLILPQIFLAMPIYGALNKDYRKVDFFWMSYKTLLAFLLIIFGVVSSILINLFYIKLGITLDSIGTMAFYNLSTLSAIILFSLARNWKHFVNYWSKQEFVFLRSPYKLTGKRLSTKIRLVVFPMFVFCVCKFFLYISSK